MPYFRSNSKQQKCLLKEKKLRMKLKKMQVGLNVSKSLFYCKNEVLFVVCIELI